MGNRTERLLAIKEIISGNKIASQEELLHLLERRGLNFTQATLSRDLKFLKVNKIADAQKGYIYKLPDSIGEQNRPIANGAYSAQGFLSLQFSNKLGVIKTLPGYASSIASIIDRASPFEIIGSIAGDDTILIIPHDNVTEQDVRNALVLIIPELKEQLT
ncbi:MAG: ArgR family transcriptional regulator [Bacteroidetes bacterium]|jgi:transcriptional regulator of arginine metabolism|nr:ArgR family transcriptional regulator [Bacteroidota bacterium]